MSNQSQTSTVSFEKPSNFLNAFFPDPDESIRFRALAAKGRDAEVSPRSFAGTRSELMTSPALQEKLIQANEERGLYFVVNSGGDSDAEIEHYNAFFAENDDLSISEQHGRLDNCPLVPSIRVETLKSVHAYWLIEGDCNEEQWRDVQERLIEYFHSDNSIKNPSRVMRLPYFNHVSYDVEKAIYSRKPVLLVKFEKNLRYTVGQMREAFPASSESPAIDHLTFTSTLDLSTWDALNAEARRRIRKLKTRSITNDGGWLHTKGLCHKGDGNKALFLNLDTGAYGCMNKCDTPTILESLGLPTQPTTSNNGIKRLIWSWREFSKQHFKSREKILFELEAGELGTLLASTDVGKTTLSLNLSLTLAAGGAFPPLANEHDGGRSVLYIDGESRKARLQGDIERMLEDFAPDKQELVKRNFHLTCDQEWNGEPLDLVKPSHREAITKAAREAKAQLIVIDTMSALFSIVNENDNAEVSQKVMRPLAKLGVDTEAAILLVHHIGKQSEDSQSSTKAYRGRGASVTGTFPRLVLMMKQDTNDRSLVSLTCAKVKGKPFSDTLLRLTDSRWFKNTGKPPVREPSSYERVVKYVKEFGRAVKRSEIDEALKDLISDSTIGKHLKAAVERGDLIPTRYGHYATPEVAQSLDAIDDERVSNFKNGAPPFQDLHGEDAHSVIA
jgi:AAA domain